MDRMSTAAAVKSNGKPETLQEQHARLISAWSATSGAPKAVLSKRIVDCEYSMELEDIDYTPWERPSTVTTKWTMTEEELISRIGKARDILNDPSKRPVMRERAERDLEKLTAQAEKRQITIPEAE